MEGVCPECEGTFDLQEHLHENAPEQFANKLRNFHRLSAAFGKLESGNGTVEGVAQALTPMQARMHHALTATNTLIKEEQPGAKRDMLLAIVAKTQQTLERESALLSWVQRGNLASARYELNALRTTLLELIALDDAYRKKQY